MHLPDSTSRDEEHRGRLVLAVLVLAAVLRLWSLDFGLPHSLTRPDETEIVGRAVRFFGWDLNPRFFMYPSLYLYLIGSVYALWIGGLALAGQSLSDTLAAAALDLSPYILMARAVSALAGVATVGALYAVGRALGGKRVGLAAALFLAVAPLHVRDGHFATTDSLLTLFVTLSALFVIRSYRTGRWQDYALAGICSGLAMSTKYVGLLMPGAIGIAWLLSLDTTVLSTPTLRLRSILRDPRPWVFGGCWLGIFLVTTPYAVLDSLLFQRHFFFQLDHLAMGHGVELGIGGVYHARYTLPLGVGWPVLLVALVGATAALRERWREAIVLLSFPALFYASTFSSHTVFLRYMLPVIPFVCLFAGFGAVRAADRVAGGGRTGAFALILVLLVAEPLLRDVGMNRLLGRTDSRVVAAAWLEDAAGPGSHTVYQTGDEWGHLQVPRDARHYADRVAELRIRAISPERQRGRDYDRAQAEVRRDAALARGTGFVYVDSTEIDAGASPDYVVLLESDLLEYSRVRRDVRDLVAARYERIHYTPGASPGRGWYDLQDAFYLPFTGFGSVARPGPDVTIFRRREATPPR